MVNPRLQQGEVVPSFRRHRRKLLSVRRPSYGRVLYNWHRYYDPSIGRYISADPIGQAGGLNLYRYAVNDPLNSIDPLGLLDALGPAANGGVDLRVQANPIPPSPGPVAIALEAEGRIFSGADFETDPHDGGFRHCVAACEAKSQFGRLGEAAVGVYDACFENEDDPNFGDDSKRDKEAEQKGLGIADGGSGCEAGCLSAFPPKSQRGP